MTFSPVRAAYLAWLKTSDQLTFDGVLECPDGAEPTPPVGFLLSVANPSGFSSAPARKSDHRTKAQLPRERYGLGAGRWSVPTHDNAVSAQNLSGARALTAEGA